MELLRLLSTSEIAAQAISFLLLFFILRAFFWKKLLKLLDDRRDRITCEFKKIDETKASVGKIRAEYEGKLKSIDDEAKARIRDALMEGHKVAEQLKKEAKEEADKIIEEAKVSTRYELAKAKEELKDEIADLVLDATEHLLEEKMTEKEDKKIVRDFLKSADKE